MLLFELEPRPHEERHVGGGGLSIETLRSTQYPDCHSWNYGWEAEEREGVRAALQYLAEHCRPKVVWAVVWAWVGLITLAVFGLLALVTGLTAVTLHNQAGRALVVGGTLALALSPLFGFLLASAPKSRRAIRIYQRARGRCRRLAAQVGRSVRADAS